LYVEKEIAKTTTASDQERKYIKQKDNAGESRRNLLLLHLLFLLRTFSTFRYSLLPSFEPLIQLFDLIRLSI
jgi:hypothetical protein